MSQYTHFCDKPDSIWPDKSKTITNHDVLDIMERIIPMRNYPPDKRYYYCNTNYHSSFNYRESNKRTF